MNRSGKIPSLDFVRNHNEWSDGLVLLVRLFVLFTLFVGAAHADIRDELKVCFDKFDADEGKSCFAKLRDEDQKKRIAERRREQKSDAEAVRTTKQAAYAESLNKEITSHLEPSYFTFASGVHIGRDQTTQAMLYEAQLFQNFSWAKWLDAPGLTSTRMSYWLDIPIRIGLRQLTTNSYPVLTPTYNPGMRLFIARNPGDSIVATPQYYSVGLHHYSNGQEVSAPDGTSITNKKYGSFNTNYVEAAVYDLWSTPLVGWSRLAFRQQFYGTWEPIQLDQYPRRELLVELHSRVHEFLKDEQGKSWKGEVRWTESFGWGYNYIVKPGTDAGNGIKAGVRDKINSTLEFSLKPPWLDELAFYARYDSGYDYYNINFQNRINRFQFGFVTR